MSLRSVVRAVALTAAAITAVAATGLAAAPAHADTILYSSRTGWYTTSRPLPSSPIGTLEGVSCAGTFCAAVGGYAVGLESDTFKAEAFVREHGSWKRSPVTYPSGRSLSAVSCTSPTFCMATEGNGRGAYRWNGHFWGLQRFPLAVRSTVAAISCSSPSFCMAVGRVGGPTDPVESPTAWIWNGSRWSVAATPKSSAPHALDGVDCLSPTFCLAVGDWTRGGRSYPFAAAFRGHFWVTSTPPVPSIYNASALTAVSCVSTADCTVAGAEGIEHENGLYLHPYIAKLHPGRWIQVAAPSAPGNGGVLTSVSCVDTSCNGVGQSIIIDRRADVVNFGLFAASSYAGGRWHTVPVPDLGHAEVMVATDSCSTATSCVAVGVYLSDRGIHEYTMAKN